MKFRIPFTYGDLETLKKKSKFLLVKNKNKKESKLQQYLDNADIELTEEEESLTRIRQSDYSPLQINDIQLNEILTDPLDKIRKQNK